MALWKSASTSSTTGFVIETSGGEIRELKLEPQSVAEFYRKFMAALHDLGIDVHIYTMPVEFPNPDSI